MLTIHKHDNVQPSVGAHAVHGPNLASPSRAALFSAFGCSNLVSRCSTFHASFTSPCMGTCCCTSRCVIITIKICIILIWSRIYRRCWGSHFICLQKSTQKSSLFGKSFESSLDAWSEAAQLPASTASNTQATPDTAHDTVP